MKAACALLCAGLASTATAFMPAAAPRALLRPATALAATKIGVFGGGVVGGGVCEIITKKAKALANAAGNAVEVKTVCVRSLDRDRDWEVPAGTTLVDSYAAVLEDPEIDMVVEVMGGVTDAKDVVFAALEAGKDVVTANKALIAAYLDEIEAKLNEVNANRPAGSKPVQLCFEAAVCGGIPVIHTLQTDFVGDTPSSLQGIMNGCTNFMLTKMEAEGITYQECLAEASALGYAEADPTLDVGGFDARSKLKIMIRLAFGLSVDEEDIACKGITDILAIDFGYAVDQLGGTIKLLGVSEIDENGELTAFVSPCFVPHSNTLASIGDATNAVKIKSDNLQETLLVGRGAGRFPTANSVVSDVVLAASNRAPQPFASLLDADLKYKSDYSMQFYMRIRYKEQMGIIKQVGTICDNYGVSIYSIQQKPDTDYFVLITETALVSAVRKIAIDIEATPWCTGETFFMPALIGQ